LAKKEIAQESAASRVVGLLLSTRAALIAQLHLRFFQEYFSKRHPLLIAKIYTMGRELQKKKRRSSQPKTKQKPKSKRVNNPRGNAIIAANWYIPPPHLH